MRTTTALLLFLLTGTATPRRAGGAPRELTTTAHAICGTQRETKLRTRLPDLVRCGNRELYHAQATVNGHALDVIGHGADPCCDDTGPLETLEGVQVFVDGVRYDPERHGGGPVTAALGPLGALADAAARDFLQAVLMLGGAHNQHLTPEEVSALIARWPATRAAIHATPPGLVRGPAGRMVRVWVERRETQPGASCHLLELHQVTLSNEGVLEWIEPTVYGEGERLGRPCAPPLPPG